MITWLKSLPRRKFIFLYIIIVTVLSLLLVGVGSWLIIPKVSADTKHVEKTDTNEGFVSESVFTGEKQEPTPKEAVFGSGYTRNDGGTTGYTLTWTGCKLVGSEEKSTTSAYAGLVAGTHYYEIKDNATGQIISKNHAFEIAQDTFNIESITTPVGFEGDKVTFQITAKATNATNENIVSTIIDYTYEIDSGDYGEPTKGIGDATKKLEYKFTKAILDSKFGALNSDSNSDKYNLDNYNSNNFRIDTYTSDNDTYITDTNNDGKSDSIAMSCIVLPTTYHRTSTTETAVDKYYGSIEQALGAVTTSGYVIVPMQSFSYTPPGTTTAKTYSSGTSFNHTISSDVTLASGVHMLLPFDSTASYTVDDSIPIPTQTIDKGALAYGTTKMKNAVTVEKGTFTVNGTLFIAGNVSGAQNGLIGSAVTNGNHSQITIESGAGIAASGNVYCYGFIDGAGTFNMNSGTLTAVFSVVEHRGGATYLGMTGHTLDEYLNIFNPPDPELQTSPFNRFYIASILAKLVSSSSAKVLGYTDLYALSEHNVTRINLVGNVNDGTDHLIDLTDGATVECKFVPNVTTNTSGTKYGQNQIKISGSATIKSLALTLTKLTVTVTLSTKDVLFPISHYWNVTLAPFPSGTAATVNSTAQDLRFLPGSALTVESGVTLTADQIAIYGEGDHTYIAEHASSVGRRTYDVTTAANVVVKGTLTATNLGGLVRAGAAGAKVKATNNYASFKELYYAQDTGEDVTFMGQALGDKIDCSYTNVTFQAKGNALISSSIVSDIVMQSGIEYNAIAFGDSFAWVYDKTITVKYDNDCDGTADTTKTQTAKSNVDVVLTGDFYPTLSKDYYEFGGWYSDAACSNAVSEGTAISSDITLYAKWTPIKYTIKHQYVYDSTFESNPSLTVPSDITDFTVEDTRLASILEKETHDPYSFVGWYSGADTGSSKALAATITPATFLKDCNASTTASSTITVYGHWTNISYNVQFVDDKYNGWTAETIKLSTAQLGSARFNEIIGELENYKESTHHTKRYYISGWKYGETSVTDFSFIDLNDTETVYKIYPVWAEKVAVNIDYGLTAKTGPKISLTNSETTAEGSGIWITPGYTYTLDSTSVKSGDDNINIAYYFNAWSASTGGTVSDYVLTIIESATAGSTVTATASWKDKHKIVSKINSGTYGSVSISVTITPNTTGSNPSYSSSGAGGTVYAKPTDTVTIKATATGTRTGSVLNRTYYGTEIVIAGAVSQTSSYTAKYYGDDKYDNENKIEKPLDLENTTATETTITISSVTL